MIEVLNNYSNDELKNIFAGEFASNQYLLNNYFLFKIGSKFQTGGKNIYDFHLFKTKDTYYVRCHPFSDELLQNFEWRHKFAGATAFSLPLNNIVEIVLDLNLVSQSALFL